MSQVVFITRDEKVRERCIEHIRNLREANVWDITIRKHRLTRSKQQNSLYWMWLKIIGDHVGSPKEDIHREFAIRLLGPETFEVDGKQYSGAKSTTKLSIEEFSEYLEKILATAMSLGLTLPTPNYYGMDQ